VRRTFERELAANGNEPEYRIGIWRVLAQAAPGDRDARVRRIADAFLDAAGPDRLHASESLGKLGYRAHADEIDAFERAARGGVNPLAVNALWVLVNTGRADAEPRLADLLTAGDEATRATAAYAVRYLRTASPATWTKLTTALTAEHVNGLVRASLAAAAFVQAPSSQRPALRYAIEQQARGDTDMKSEVCGALAMAGEADDVLLLATLIGDSNVDVRIGAARALLEIDRRARR
jgi:SSS family solute:Na+ symporter